MAPIRKKVSARLHASTPSKASASASVAAVNKQHKSSPSRNHKTQDSLGSEDDFANWRLSKKDKRAVKRGLLLQKVVNAGISKNKTKRRRPSKKLKTDLSSLANALPEVSEDEWEGISQSESSASEAEGELGGEGINRRRRRRKNTTDGIEGKIKMKSLRHAPGAMKKKRLAEGREMERFRRNLAQLADSTQAPRAPDRDVGSSSRVADSTTNSEKWEALRRFISSTMEKDKAFAESR